MADSAKSYSKLKYNNHTNGIYHLKHLNHFLTKLFFFAVTLLLLLFFAPVLVVKESYYLSDFLVFYFIGKSATLYETANPDWAPTLRLGRDRAKDYQAGSVRGKTKRKRKLDSSSDDTLFALSVCNSELQQRCQPLTNVGSESYRKTVHKFLKTKEVMDLLMLPDEVFSSQPPCEPIRGEIYLMKIDPSQESSDWTKDGYTWLSLGSNDLILNQSPALRQSTFRMLVNEIETCLLKHVYRSFNNNQKVVIHYVTDERLNNSKSYPHSMDITGTSSVPQTHLGITQYYHQLVEDCNVDSQKSSEALWEMAPTKEKSVS